MSREKLLPALLLTGSVLLHGCAPGDAPQRGADAPGAALDIDALVAAADPARGRTQFILCQACHSVEEGGPHKVGPNLWDFYGREAAQAPGFSYSPALQNAGIVWDNAALDAFLERPSQLVPGNNMVFVGIRDPRDRAAVIAWLIQQTGPAGE